MAVHGNRIRINPVDMVMLAIQGYRPNITTRAEVIRWIAEINDCLQAPVRRVSLLDVAGRHWTGELRHAGGGLSSGGLVRVGRDGPRIPALKVNWRAEVETQIRVAPFLNPHLAAVRQRDGFELRLPRRPPGRRLGPPLPPGFLAVTARLCSNRQPDSIVLRCRRGLAVCFCGTTTGLFSPADVPGCASPARNAAAKITIQSTIRHGLRMVVAG